MKATYSPEDNKIRIYPSARLDETEWQEMKTAGWRWAPKQEIFYIHWSPAAEDKALGLAGEIEPEETTLAERAEAKAERLEALSEKRAIQSGQYAKRADELSQRFYMGQPILAGHHSERKARKDAEKMDNEQRRAIAAAEASNYWSYRASGVEHHANYKNKPAVIARRIKTLLKELRDYQRAVNKGHTGLNIWNSINETEDKEARKKAVSWYSGYDNYAPFGTWRKHQDGELTDDEVIEIGLKLANARAYGVNRQRCIIHTLNRLGYERGQLGEVQRYEDELKATTLQTFARTHGAEKPKAEKVEGGYKLTSSVPLPAHIAEGESICLSEAEWRDLMQSVGYEVPYKAPASAKPKLLNLDIDSIEVQRYGRSSIYPVVKMTKAEHKAKHSDYKGTAVSSCGGFKIRTAMIGTGGSLSLAAIFLTDSKAHDLPESGSINKQVEAA